jgi:hypothetical protein
MKSKIITLAIAALVMTGFAAKAQEQQTVAEPTLTTKVGIKGGVNFSNFYGDNISDKNMKVGFNAGLYAKVPVTRGFSIQPELLYTSLGNKSTYNNFAQGSGEYRFNLNYIQLPVLAVINVVSNLNIHVGPYVAYLTDANIKDVSSDGTVNHVTDLKADDFYRFDYGLAGGLGFDVDNFTIGARYNYGMSEIGHNSNASTFTGNAKNSAFNLYIGFAF